MFSDDLEIEWDPAKDEINFKKHGIHFEEAAQVFQDPSFSRQQPTSGSEARASCTKPGLRLRKAKTTSSKIPF